MLEKLTVDTFHPHVGTTFRVELGDGLELVLGDARAHEGETGGPTGRSQFSLTFQGPPEPVLPQQIYPLDHPILGHLDLFLVPLAAGPEGATYEAVFA